MPNFKKADAVAVYFRRSGASALPQRWTDEDLYAWLAARGYSWCEDDYAWHLTRSQVSLSESRQTGYLDDTQPITRRANRLQPVIVAIRQKRIALATELLKPIIADNPTADAWFLAAYTTNSREAAIRYLENALTLNPYHQKAINALAELQTRKERSTASKLFAQLFPQFRQKTRKKRQARIIHDSKRKICPNCGSRNIMSVREHQLAGCGFMAAAFWPMIFIGLLSIFTQFARGQYPRADEYICYTCGANFFLP